MNMLDTICKIISEELDQQGVSEATTLEELGMDSLEFVSLMQAIGKQVQEIPETEWSNLRSVGDIVAALRRLP